MIYLNIHKAQPVCGKTVKSVKIGIRDEIPVMSPIDANRYYLEQAKMLADTLVNTLPGGTLDQLIVCLLQHKLSQLRVPSFKSDEEIEKII